MKTKLQHVIALLLRWDFVWSGPLAFGAFIKFEEFGQARFGEQFASYDPSVFQAAIMAALIMLFANSIALGGLKFNWPGSYEYYITDEKNDFKTFTPWQKHLFIALRYAFYFVAFLMLFLKLV